MIHVYAVVEGLRDVPDIGGVGDAPVDVAEVGGLAVVLSRAQSAPNPAEAEVLRHARVVEALMSRSECVLPARFTAAFASEESMVTAVSRRRDALQQALARVAGCVELGLCALEAEAERQTVRGGREYMTVRLARFQETERLIRDVHVPLAELTREATVRAGTPPVLFTAAYLAPRDTTEAFRAQLDRLQETHSHHHFVCSGPWPPYSFTSIPDAARNGD